MNDEYEMWAGGSHTHTIAGKRYGAREHARPTGTVHWLAYGLGYYKLMAEFVYGSSAPIDSWTSWSIMLGLGDKYIAHHARTGESAGPFDTLEEAQNYAVVRYRLNPREGME